MGNRFQISALTRDILRAGNAIVEVQELKEHFSAPNGLPRLLPLTTTNHLFAVAELNMIRMLISQWANFDTTIFDLEYQVLEELIERNYRSIYLSIWLQLSRYIDGGYEDDDVTIENERPGKKRLSLIFDFRRYFHERLSTLKQQPEDESSPYSRKSDIARLRLPPEPRSAWKDGMRVMRHLQRGKLPETVEQVVLCIMTADAMRSSNCANSYVRNQDEFMRDLHRWKDVVPPNDKKLFEQVVYRLWKRKLDSSKNSYQSDNLFHFQEVFQKLLSELDIEELPLNAYNREQLLLFQSGHANRPNTPPSPRYDHGLNSNEDASSHRSEIYTGNWTPYDYLVILLAATVIFCVVIAVMMYLFHSQAYTKFTILLQKIPCHGTDLSSTHKRNCILIACYIGLPTRTIESIPFSDGFNPKAPRPCCVCGERLSSTNMKRHITTRHAQEQIERVEFPCKYCLSEHSRSDNRDAHEKTCKARHESQAPAAPRHDLDAILPGVNQPTDCHGQHAAEDWLASDQPLSVLPEFNLNATALDLESFTAPAQSLPTGPDFDFANTSENHQTNPLGQQPLDFSNALSSSQDSPIPTQPNTLDTFPAPPTGAHQPSWPPSTHDTFNTMTMPSGTHNPGSLMYDQSGLAQRSPTNQAFFPDLTNMSFSGVPDASTADFQPTALLPTSAFQSSTSFPPQWNSTPLPTAPAELDFFNLTPDFSLTSNPFGAASMSAWIPEQQINGYSGLELGLGLGQEALASDHLFAPNPTSKRKEPCSMDEISLIDKRARTADVEAFDWDGVGLA